MKQKLSVIVVILVFLVGIGIMSYPFISSMINNANMRSSVYDYEEKVEKLDKKDYSNMLSKAKTYNNSLSNTAIITDPFDEAAYKKIGADYTDTMNVDGNGLIGYVDIPKIDTFLPIYHGTGEEILSKGAGHLMNTSMPIGGKSTHSVISAHSAYPGQTFFDYLLDMKKGDTFYIKVLDKTLQYEVDKISVVLPDDLSELRIIPDEDHVTLLTCTPYSINTHRLLVRGKRVPYVPESKDGNGATNLDAADYFFFMGYKVKYWVAIAVTAGFVALVGLVVFIVIKRNRKKGKRIASNKEVQNVKGKETEEKKE